MDDFMNGLFDIQLETTQRAVAELNRVRAENAALKKQLREFDSSASELLDRCTSLEIALQKAKHEA